MKVSALARERIGGLQSIAAEPHQPRITLVGHRWDTATSNLRRFLARNQISFHWFTPGAPELSTHWPGTPPTGDDGPVVRLADGQVIVAPEARDLANRLGLQITARSAEYDVAIIGGGPAGLAAAVYGASEGLRTIVIEREAPGGKLGRLRVLRTISDFRVAFRATNLRVGRSSKPGGSAPKFWLRDRLQTSIHRRERFFSMATTLSGHELSSQRRA